MERNQAFGRRRRWWCETENCAPRSDPYIVKGFQCITDVGKSFRQSGKATQQSEQTPFPDRLDDEAYLQTYAWGRVTSNHNSGVSRLKILLILFLFLGQGFLDSFQFGVGDSPYLRGHFVNFRFHFC